VICRVQATPPPGNSASKSSGPGSGDCISRASVAASNCAGSDRGGTSTLRDRKKSSVSRRARCTGPAPRQSQANAGTPRSARE
jgi:hypothetical protein